MIDPLTYLMRWPELFTDAKDGRLSSKKIGEVVVGVTWTAFMWRNQPESVEMWIAYAGTMLTWSTAQFYIKRGKLDVENKTDTD